MLRRIVNIEEQKCNGCGACAKACHESAIEIINGKAKLVRDDYCDGMGDCLPECPMGAISFETREAAAYDEAAVKKNQQQKMLNQIRQNVHEPDFSNGGCPGSKMRQMNRGDVERPFEKKVETSQLQNWPVQIKLAPTSAPYYQGAKLLIAADCTAYAYAQFHQEFIRGKTTLIGCPKLDSVDYSEKLTQIIAENDIKSITIVRMEVPCCGGLEMAAKKALQSSGKFIPWQVVTIGINGNILED